MSFSWGGVDHPQDSIVVLNGRKIGTVVSPNSEKNFYLLPNTPSEFWGLTISLDGLNTQELIRVANELIDLANMADTWKMAYESATRSSFSIDQRQSESLESMLKRMVGGNLH